MSNRFLPRSLLLNVLSATMLLGGATAEAAEPLPRLAANHQPTIANRLPKDLSAYRLKSALELDVEGNDSYTSATQAILTDQILSDFAEFDQVGRQRSGLFDKPPFGGAQFPFYGPLKLAHVEVENPYSGSPSRANCPASGSCELPLDYNVSVPAVKMIWSFRNSTIKNQFLQYINETNSKELRVSVNGDRLSRKAVRGIAKKDFDYLAYYGTGKTCVSSMPLGCLVVVAVRDAWFDGPSPWTDWSVHIEGVRVSLTRVGPSSTTELAAHWTVEPKARVKDFFTATIGRSTMSERCTSCHDMDTPDAITNRHGFSLDPELDASIVNDDEFVHHAPACQGCHGSAMPDDFHETRWATPTVEQDINWSEIINANTDTWPTEICNRMVNNLEDADAREEHFHEDARLFWAVSDGSTPSNGQLNTSHPKDYGLFIERFDAWNAAGAPCPQ